MISAHDFPSVKGGQVTTAQEVESHTDVGSTQIISGTVTDHTDFDQQTQFVTQDDFSDSPHSSTIPDQEISPIEPNGPSVPSESFPPEQTRQKVYSGVKGHRNHQIPSRFDQQPIIPSFVPDTEAPLIPEQISSQPPSTDFTPDTQGPLDQQEINGQPTSPDFIPDSEGHLTQHPINGQTAFPDFVPDTQGPLDQQQINGQPTFTPDSERFLTQQELNGQAAFQDFDSQVHVAQEQISGQSNMAFKDGHQNLDDGQYHHFGNPVDWLRTNVPGNPGEDYPIFYTVPQTSFDCKQQQFSSGIYGDMEASCQVKISYSPLKKKYSDISFVICLFMLSLFFYY